MRQPPRCNRICSLCCWLSLAPRACAKVFESGAQTTLGDNRRRIEAIGNSVVAAIGAKYRNRLKAVVLKCHCDEILGRECRPAGAATERELQSAHAVIAAVHHFGTHQPITAEEIELKIVELAFVR